MEVNWDYRLDPPPDPAPDDRDDYDSWLDAHSDITWRGSLAPDDLFVPDSAAAWADLYRRDLEEPDGWDQDWRDLA